MQHGSLRRRCLLSIAALGLLGLSACANENVAACTDYVDKVNAVLIECGDQPIYSVEETCPESLGSGSDCTAYYECLGNGHSCTIATQTVTANIADCSCS